MERPGRSVIDDQYAGQAAAQLLDRVAMRVEEECAGIRRREAVGKALAGQNRHLRDIGNAVHRVLDAHAVPVNRRVFL
jgi:hypothetical protein